MLAGTVRPTGAVGGDVHLVDHVEARGETGGQQPGQAGRHRRPDDDGRPVAPGIDVEAQQGGAVVGVVRRRDDADAGWRASSPPPRAAVVRWPAPRGRPWRRSRRGRRCRHPIVRRARPTGPRGCRARSRSLPRWRDRRAPTAPRPTIPIVTDQFSVGNSRQPPRCGGTPPRPRKRMHAATVPATDSATSARRSSLMEGLQRIELETASSSGLPGVPHASRSVLDEGTTSISAGPSCGAVSRARPGYHPLALPSNEASP